MLRLARAYPSRRLPSMRIAQPVPTEISTVSLRSLLDQKVGAADGDVGFVRDFFFDASSWTLRYVAADAAGWLPGRVLLFSPPCFGSRPFGIGTEEPTVLRVTMTRLKIARGPSIEPGRGVSARDEAEHRRHHGMNDMAPANGAPAGPEPAPPRGFRALLGRPLRLGAGAGGTLRDFIVDRRTWRIRELVVGTGRWFSSREVRVDSGDFESDGTAHESLGVKLTRAELDNAPRDGLARRGAAAPS